MFNILVPKDHFLFADYPYMEDYIVGLPIPIGWGDIHDIVPFCVDTDFLIYKILGHAIQDITEIRSKGIALGAASYVPNLPVAEFELAGTPWLASGTTYYFAIAGDFAITGTDYLYLRLAASAVGFESYNIDGTPTWSAQARDLIFDIYGKVTMDGEEQLMVSTNHIKVANRALRDAAARTRLGQKFVTGSRSFYVTRLRVYLDDFTGTPTGNLWATFYSAVAPEVQQGIEGNRIEFDTSIIPAAIDLTLPQYGEDSDLLVDVESPYPMLTIGADILESLFVDRLGKDAALLDPVHLAAFAASRYQELKVYVDREISVGEFIGKLEASLLFKFVPLQDGTYGTIVFAAGVPAGTPHFRDIDFVEGAPFRIEHDAGVIRHVVRVKYDENPATQEFKISTARSDYARLFYSNEETQEVETWLKEETDADDLAADYSRFFEKPQVRVTFEIHGSAMTLLPGRDKVRLTRSRAAWTGGEINGELFRVMRAVKKPSTNTTEITAILDTETY